MVFQFCYAPRVLRHLIVACTVGTILLLASATLAQSSRNANEPASAIPARAAHYRPWDAVQSYRLTLVDVQPRGGQAAKTEKPDTAADFWKPWFNDAILFEMESSRRLVTVGKQPPSVSVDYIEIRQTGNGFGVNTNNYSAKSHLYLESFRMTRPTPNKPGPVRVEFEATINYTGATRKPNDKARLVFTAVQLDGAPASGAESPPLATASPQPEIATATPPTTVTVSDAPDTSSPRRTTRRTRR